MHDSYRSFADHKRTVRRFAEIAAKAMLAEGRHARAPRPAPARFLRIRQGGAAQARCARRLARCSRGVDERAIRLDQVPRAASPTARREMKVLQLYANYKWTGPADLALLQARELHAACSPCGGAFRDCGLDASRATACDASTSRGDPPAVRGRAAAAPTLPPTHDLERCLSARAVDRRRRASTWLHCHQGGDHFLAALAAGQAARPVTIVRSFWEDKLAAESWGGCSLPSSARNALIGPFASRVRSLGERFELAADNVHVVPPILDAAFGAPNADERGTQHVGRC